jgi:hypothetical protein
MRDERFWIELLNNQLVGAICNGYSRSRHVRRVAGWIGLVLKGIEWIGGSSLKRYQRRQVQFEYAGRRFRGRFNHELVNPKLGRRGGLEIVEVLAVRGGRLRPVLSITSLDEAEDAYLHLQEYLDRSVSA